MSHTQEPTTAPDLDALWRQWRDQAVENWSWMAGQTASSQAFLETGTAMMDCYLASAQKMRETVGESLDAMEIPRRSDLARLSTQVLTVEARVADLEDGIDGLHKELRSVGRLLEALKSSLDHIKDFDARLAGLEKALEASARPAAEAPVEAPPATPVSKTRRRKTS